MHGNTVWLIHIILPSFLLELRSLYTHLRYVVNNTGPLNCNKRNNSIQYNIDGYIQNQCWCMVLATASVLF